MGMQIGGNDDDMMMEINTTPLIDVMLVLLIMLIITIPIQTHAVKLDMPVNSPSKSTEKPEIVQIDIGSNNVISWAGVPLADRAALEKNLSDAASKAVQPEFHIRPDKDANYESVALVLASSQRLGVKKIGIVGHEQFIK
ncbi:ExbD/TolR family protein [Iodobacter fluviatilis]|uniref:Biopolymer transport protein exbD n=1 Tax=Iodobacter fluviatilis TaxID=537 RepID=A0A377Q7A6_9NEIS|nr:biopolymer transporter ExbD [Iodobacter fluviatilis]TCU89239.1 outer membrane transport energization protein ExbD [Iodobacter fluviatilis]STQ90608.1 Biopolymer transport protein exbD [Iodobacter fluviatilis]